MKKYAVHLNKSEKSTSSKYKYSIKNKAKQNILFLILDLRLSKGSNQDSIIQSSKKQCRGNVDCYIVQKLIKETFVATEEHKNTSSYYF